MKASVYSFQVCLPLSSAWWCPSCNSSLQCLPGFPLDPFVIFSVSICYQYSTDVPCPSALSTCDLFRHVWDLSFLSHPYVCAYMLFNKLLSIHVYVVAASFFLCPVGKCPCFHTIMSLIEVHISCRLVSSSRFQSEWSLQPAVIL